MLAKTPLKTSETVSGSSCPYGAAGALLDDNVPAPGVVIGIFEVADIDLQCFVVVWCLFHMLICVLASSSREIHIP